MKAAGQNLVCNLRDVVEITPVQLLYQRESHETHTDRLGLAGVKIQEIEGVRTYVPKAPFTEIVDGYDAQTRTYIPKNGLS